VGLPDDVLIEYVLDLLWDRQTIALLGLRTFRYLFPDDVIAQLDTFVADEDGWSGDELADFMLALATEGAV
jgi:hypothetical protein